MRRFSRRGVGLGEVVVLVLILSVVALLLLMGLARARETARLAQSQKNLMQIGRALALYDQMVGRLPMVPAELLRPDAALPKAETGSPQAALLLQLGLDDLSALADPNFQPKAAKTSLPPELFIPSFISPSDPNALGRIFQTPISYRANTGDTPEGRNGPFSVGRSRSLQEVEAADGLAYTAGFSERLLGDGRSGHPVPINYQIASAMSATTSCPEGVATSAYRGDAGSSWLEASWRSTLYHHGVPPMARSSCIRADGILGQMGASSGHPNGVNVLYLDGSVRMVKPSIDPAVWRQMGRIDEVTPSESTEAPK